jgi:hypothetical protein
MILKLLAAVGRVVGVGLDVAIFVDQKLTERNATKRAIARARRIQSERYREASNKAGKP